MPLTAYIDLKRKSSTEFCGACPACGGEDRFLYWPKKDKYWCRQCEISGDLIQYLREFEGMTFKEAASAAGRHDLTLRFTETPATSRPARCEATRPPSRTWMNRARFIAERSVETLWGEDGRRALDWLRGRGFDDGTIRFASLGYNSSDLFEDQDLWGFTSGKRIWIPRGITIPWVYSRGGDYHDVWRLNIRRPVVKPGEDKYIGPRGFAQGLYNAHLVKPGAPALLVEGELDAMTAVQAQREARDEFIIPVATGSTSHARRDRWVNLLSLASVVLVAYDSDDAGEKASRWWTEHLPNAIRWRPFWSDVNDMKKEGGDVLAWMKAGLENAPTHLQVAAA